MTQKSIWMFPGQGAQVKGMGAGLFERFPRRAESASDVLGYDVARLCTEDAENRLNQTRFTQPALYVVNGLHYMAQVQDGGRPDVVLGHSLGEYNALVAAGVMDFEQGLELVKHRACCMAAYATGAMAAVLKLSLGDLQAILAGHPSGGEIDVANINSREQIVIAGTHDALEFVRPALEEAGAFVVPLKVSGAFHSRHMTDAAREFAEVVAGMRFRAPAIPVISNVTARPHEHNLLADRLVQHVYSPVRWLDSIEFLLQSGDCDFREVGVGQTLGRLLRQIRMGVEAQTLRPFRP